MVAEDDPHALVPGVKSVDDGVAVRPPIDEVARQPELVCLRCEADLLQQSAKGCIATLQVAHGIDGGHILERDDLIRALHLANEGFHARHFNTGNQGPMFSRMQPFEANHMNFGP